MHSRCCPGPHPDLFAGNAPSQPFVRHRQLVVTTHNPVTHRPRFFEWLGHGFTIMPLIQKKHPMSILAVTFDFKIESRRLTAQRRKNIGVENFSGLRNDWR